jgi:hypothetical protein
MTPQKTPLSENRLTTIAGGLSTVAGLAISLIPHDVWKTCSDAVSQTANPAFTAGLVAAGLALTLAGPSLTKKK